MIESTLASRKVPVCLSRLFRLISLIAILVIVSPFTRAQSCGTPGKDGSPGTITGVVNTYYPGAADVAAASTSISLGAATGASTAITSGDMLLVIQMQDASINSSNTNSYGNGVSGNPAAGYTNANNVGRYEFVRATNAVPLTGGTVTIAGTGGGGGLINAYVTSAVAGQGQRRFQVVRVPQYVTVTLSSGLTALAWNGATGGILALDVRENVFLNSATVSVAGKGFRGGAGLQLQGAGGANTDYRSTAPTSATTTTGFHGAKGEGIAGTPRFVWNSGSSVVVDTGVEGYPNGSMARGAPGNAGGGGTDGRPDGASPGGNDENSGGGGGGNGGAAGIGGNTWNSNLARGGFAGVSFTQAAAGRVVMGGGGGAGTRNNDPGDVAASGGAGGGGIVVIRARYVVGIGTINADGAAAYNNTLNDGGGGGGAGGSVVIISLNASPGGLTVTARGGRGGDAWHSQAPNGDPGERHGPGGGGGGGRVFLSGPPVSIIVTGGANGITTTANDPYGAAPGSGGVSATNVTPGQIPGVSSGAECFSNPTAVDAISFKATKLEGRVLLEWQTGYEVNNIGFNIYREKGGNLSQVTPEPVAGSALIAGPAIQLRAGFAYSWWDNDAGDDDASVRYWLEDIDMSGRTTTHGPFGIDRQSPDDQSPASGKTRVSLLSAFGRDASEHGSTMPVEPMAKVAKPTAAKIEIQASMASQQAVKMSIQREGWYRVEQPELVAAGLPNNTDPRKLQLFVDGEQIPMTVTGEKDGQFDPADRVEFYGVGINSASTVNHVYWLVAGAEFGLRIQHAKAKSGSPAANTFSYAIERRDKLIYVPALKNGGGEKFFGPLIYNAQPTDQSLVLQHVAPSGSDALLEVSLQGFTQTGHSVRVMFNGSELGLIKFNGLEKGTAKYPIAQSSLREGSNQVQLISPPGYTDISLAEYVRLTYLHTNAADGNALRFAATGTQQVTITGFTGSTIRVIDVTSVNSVQEIDGAAVKSDGQGFSVTFNVPRTGSRTLLALAADQQKKPAAMVANQASSWRYARQGADYVAVTQKELMESLLPLVAHRKAQGLSMAVVDVEDIYDEFSFGNKSPQALKDFFTFANTNWAKAPRFALLAGDATFDPKNYMGAGDFDLVPTKLVETAFNETATDDWFVDVNGDGVPDIAIGRLPVRSSQEMAALVSKIVGYDKSAATNTVLLVADQNDGFDFESADTQLQALIPGGLTQKDIRRGQVGDAAARSQLLEAISQGQKLVNFYGHGSTRLWTSAPLLTTSDAASLGNRERLALFDSMTCLNGFFHDPTIESLGEALLKSPGGAIAVWASSGMTDASAQVQMNEEAIRQLFSGARLTIGEVAARAKAAASNVDVRRTWILLGDPATRLR